jgi:3-methylcrotonyl-CoA carboxylase beta subunit
VAILASELQPDDASRRRAEHWRGELARLSEEEARLRAGGGESAQERQRQQGKMSARERVAALCDPIAPFLE